MTAAERLFLALLGLAGLTSLAGVNAGFGGLALFFAARLLSGRWRGGLPHALLALLVVWSAVAALLSPHRALSVRALPDLWAWLALLVASALAPEVRRRLEFYSLPLALSALAAGLLAAGAFLFGTSWRAHLWSSAEGAGLPTGAFFSHHLTLAGAASVAGFFLAGQALYGEHPRWQRICLATGAAACGAALLFSQARSYYLAALPAALVLLLGKGAKRALLAVGASLLLAVALLAVGPPTLRLRALSTFDPANTSNVERLCLWRSGLAMAAERPLVGWGPGTYRAASPPYRAPYASRIHHPGSPPGFQTDCHAHSFFLMVLLETGLVGLGLLFALLAAALRSVLRQPDPALRFGVLAALTAFLVGALFEHNGGDAEVSILLAFVLGLALPGRDPGRP